MDSETQLIIIDQVAILLSRLGHLNLTLSRFQEGLFLTEELLQNLETFRYSIRDAQNGLYAYWDDLKVAHKASRISEIDFDQLKLKYEIGCNIWHTNLANAIETLSKDIHMDDFSQKLFEILEKCVRIKFDPFPEINRS